MKKMLFLIGIIILGSCSSDDTVKQSYYQGQRYMDPPVWIQGIWIDQNHREFKFTDRDILYKYPMQNYSSTSDEIHSYENYYWKEFQTYQNPNVQEVELTDYYSIKYNCLDSPSKKFSFIRISDTQIESTGLMPGIYTKQ